MLASEPQTAQAAPQAADPRNCPAATPATAAPPTLDGAGTRRPGADLPHQLEKSAPAAVDLDPARLWPPGLPMLPDATPPTALDAALALIAAGLPVLPVALTSGKGKGKKAGRKVPTVSSWQYPAAAAADHGAGRKLKHSTLDPDTARAWWGPGGRYRSCGVGAALRAPGRLAVEGDGPEANAGLSAAAAAAGGLPATWAIGSTRGPKAIYTRPAELADDTVKWTNRNYEHRAELGGADLILGYVLAWAPGRRWFGSPADVAACPTWLADTARAIATPAPKPDRPTPPAHPTPPAGPRPRTSGTGKQAERFILGLIAWWARRIESLRPDGTQERSRGKALFAGARKVGELLHLAPHLEPDAIAAFEAAAVASGYVDDEDWQTARAHIMRGLATGKAEPKDLPEAPGRAPGRTRAVNSAGVTPTQPNGADRVRAAALACLADLGARVRRLADDDDKPIHFRTAKTVYLVAGEILQRMAATGGPVIDSAEALGLPIDRGGAAVWRAFPWLVRLGLNVEIGAAVGADDGPHGSRFTLSDALLCQLEIGARAHLQTTHTRQRPTNGAPANVHFVLTEEEIEHAAVTLATVATAGEDLSRGLRRQLDDGALQDLAQGEDLGPTGDYTPAALAVVEAAGDDGLTYAELAAALGCSESTARRIGPRMVARGAWLERARLSPAGRRLVVFVSAVASTRILEIVKAVGARARRWAEGRIEAGREILRKAWELVRGGYFGTVGAALYTLRRKARERAEAERAAVSPGGERGRPGWDREGAGRALANAAAWAKHNAEAVGVKS